MPADARRLNPRPEAVDSDIVERFGWMRGVVVALALVMVACGGRFEPSALDANDAILAGLTDIPGAEPVSVETYGYDAGDEETGDDFFTEVEYEVVEPAATGDIVETVAARLDGWDSEVTGDGDALVATFKKGQARVSLTTWDGGFDVTVAAEGGRLDDTRLSLAP